MTKQIQGGERIFLGSLALVGLFWCLPLIIPRMPERSTVPILIAFVAVHIAYLWASGRALRCRLTWVASFSAIAGACALASMIMPQWKGWGDVSLVDFSSRVLWPVVDASGLLFVVYALLHLLGWTVGNSVRRGRLRRF